MRRSESKMVRTNINTISYNINCGAAQADYGYALNLSAYLHCHNLFGGEGLIKPKSILVETRKMVNYARTW